MDHQAARYNMIESQVRPSDVTDPAICDAMRTVVRERFCAPSRAFAAYADMELEICPGRWLMRPREVGKLLQAVAPRPGETALAIAAPYAAALLSVIGLKVRAQEGDARAAAILAPALEDYGVELELGDLKTSIAQGLDLIVCEGAVSEPPRAWFDALKVGGRLAVVERNGPVGKARVYQRIAAGVTSREVFDSTPPVLPGFERAIAFEF